MPKVLGIPRTLNVVTTCWDLAETDLRDEIARNHPGILEVAITELFCGFFAERLREASATRSVSRAFLDDLRAGSPELPLNVAANRAEGLVADVTFHDHKTERRSGGDLGLLIARPLASITGGMLRIRDYRRDLLVQAKRKKGRRYQPLSGSQVSVLRDRLEYTALLLYEFADTEGYLLTDFKWQPCHEAVIADLVKWLKTNQFPSPVSSPIIIGALGSAMLGTDNDEIINSIISTAHNRAVEIRIYWPAGRPPDAKVQVGIRQGTTRQIKVLA